MARGVLLILKELWIGKCHILQGLLAGQSRLPVSLGVLLTPVHVSSSSLAERPSRRSTFQFRGHNIAFVSKECAEGLPRLSR